MKFSDVVHIESFKQYFPLIKRNDRLCDLILDVHGEKFKVHRDVLTQFCPYFRNCLSFIGFNEKNKDVVTIADLPPDLVDVILNYIYTSTIEILDDNVFSLIATADFLGLTGLRVGISCFLLESLSFLNCFEVFITSQLFRYKDVAEVAFRRCLRQSREGVDQFDLTRLSFDALLKFFSAKQRFFDHESTFIETAITWVNMAPIPRKPKLSELLSHVKLKLLHLEELIRIQRIPILKDEKNFQVALAEALFYREKICRGHIIEPPYEKVIREVGVLLAIGGLSQTSATGNVECYIHFNGNWKTSIPKCIDLECRQEETLVIPAMLYPRIYAAVAHDCYRVFVIGGDNNNEVLNSCEVYDVRTNEWSLLPPLPETLACCAATMCDDRIFVCGGKLSANLYEFDPEKKEWKLLPPLPDRRWLHCMVSAHGFLYVLGGITEPKTTTSTMYRYDILNSTWAVLPNFSTPRHSFAAAIYNSSIYIFGGLGEQIKPLSSCERYDLLQNEWHPIPSMKLALYHFSVSVLNNHIYCIGGNNSMDCVNVFSPLTEMWGFSAGMKFPNERVRGVGERGFQTYPSQCYFISINSRGRVFAASYGLVVRLDICRIKDLRILTKEIQILIM